MKIMKTRIDDKILKILNSKNYQEAKIGLNKILKRKTISNEDIILILSLSNKIIISDFFYLFPNFTVENFIEIEKFINSNLKHRNKLFVSDLIEIATDFNLEINYKKCIALLRNYKDDNHYVLIASIEYIFSNLKTRYIAEIFNGLNYVLSNKDAKQIARIFSSFYLYRITYKKTYFIQLRDLLAIDKDNKTLLLNLLKKDFNKKQYFEDYKSLIKLTK